MNDPTRIAAALLDELAGPAAEAAADRRGAVLVAAEKMTTRLRRHTDRLQPVEENQH